MVIACLVGSLVGDSWMKLPGLCRLSQEHKFWFGERLPVIAGTYSLPVWQWGKINLADADYEIVEVVDDPDDPQHPYCPGFGHPAMQAAIKDVQEQRPDERVIGGDQIPTCYYRNTPKLALKEPFVHGSWIAMQPYTRHSWKNCRNVILRAEYPFPVKVLGLPGEAECSPRPAGWEYLTDATFDEQVAAVAGCKFFVGVGSSWSNAATLFHKPQIHVSYTADLAQFTNPRMVKLVEPTLDQLQTEIDKQCAA